MHRNVRTFTGADEVIEHMTDRDEKGFKPTRTIPGRAGSGGKSVVPKAYLVLLTGERAGTHHPIPDDHPTVIGRDSECQIRTDDRDVSRRHAAIHPLGRDFLIVDMDSTNGTMVNGRQEARRILRHADKISIGQQIYQFLLFGPDGSPLLHHTGG